MKRMEAAVRIAGEGRRSIDQQDEYHPTQLTPAYKFDQRIARQSGRRTVSRFGTSPGDLAPAVPMRPPQPRRPPPNTRQEPSRCDTEPPRSPSARPRQAVIRCLSGRLEGLDLLSVRRKVERKNGVLGKNRRRGLQ